MKYLERIRDMLCEELEEIAEKGEISAGGLDLVDKLTHSIKSIDTIIAMKESGYSERNYPRYYYRDEYSGRKRDSMGRYSREGDHVVMELREAMNMATDNTVRDDIKRIIDKVERM